MSGPPAIRWTPLNSAHYLVDASLMVVGRAPGSLVRITTTWSVLEHPEGVVVIDTGVDPATAATAGGSEPAAGQAVMEPGGSVTERLGGLGLRASDVRFVVNTHLHLDHTGGNRELAHADFLSQSAELDYARAPDDATLAAEYRSDLIAEGTLRYTGLQGGHDLFGDGSVVLLPSAGHSAGHQSVLLRLARLGHVLVLGDAIWTRDSTDDDTLPGVLWSGADYRASRRRLLDVARATRAHLFFAHEPAGFGPSGWQEGRSYG